MARRNHFVVASSVFPPFPSPVLPASSLHAVSRYPTPISGALDMKGLQMQFDGFMLRIIHKQAASQWGELEAGNKGAAAAGLTSRKRSVNTEVVVLQCSRFTLFSQEPSRCGTVWRAGCYDWRK